LIKKKSVNGETLALSVPCQKEETSPGIIMKMIGRE
jgi:hypothetical protein